MLEADATPSAKKERYLGVAPLGGYMADISNGQTVPSGGNTPPETGMRSAPGNTWTSLAAQRAEAQHQESAPAAQSPGEPGGTTPTGERSEYIPRDRFDQVNNRLKEAEARLAQMQYAPQTMSGMQGQQAQPQITQQQVENMLARVSNPDVREEWRRKIVNKPVEGLAEFVHEAIRTDGARLLQEEMAKIYSQLAPIQQTMQQQVVSSYASSRANDPTWQQVAPTFNSLVAQALQQGAAINAQTLPIVEAVARQQVGLPLFGVGQAPATHPPFSERPGSSQGVSQGAPAPQLNGLEQYIAQRFGMSPDEYARERAEIRRSNR